MKTYVGNGKEGKYGYVNFTLDVDKLIPYVFEYKGKKYVKLTMSKKKEVDQYGKSHTVYIDELIQIEKQYKTCRFNGTTNKRDN
jgi:hypothetical protein